MSMAWMFVYVIGCPDVVLGKNWVVKLFFDWQNCTSDSEYNFVNQRTISQPKFSLIPCLGNLSHANSMNTEFSLPLWNRYASTVANIRLLAGFKNAEAVVTDITLLHTFGDGFGPTWTATHQLHLAVGLLRPAAPTAATPEVYERTPVKATAGFSGMATQRTYLHIVSLAHSSATRRPLSASFEPPLHCCYAWLVLRVMLIPLTYWERDYRRPIRAGFHRSALGRDYAIWLDNPE